MDAAVAARVERAQDVEQPPRHAVEAAAGVEPADVFPGDANGAGEEDPRLIGRPVRGGPRCERRMQDDRRPRAVVARQLAGGELRPRRGAAAAGADLAAEGALQLGPRDGARAWDYLDMFVEAGFDCYQSLQTGVMDLRELKHSYGRNLAFWGGVPVELLVGGTPDEVRQAVRAAMDAGRGGGGFILGPSHSVAYGTKYDNFMAMIDEHDRLKHGSRG